MLPEEYFEGHPLGMVVFERVRRAVESLGPIEVRTSKSQVALARHGTFAWIWLPGKYLRHAHAEVVLSLALGRRDDSVRWKQVSQPSPRYWMHHLEIDDADDLDDEVFAWLREAAEGVD